MRKCIPHPAPARRDAKPLLHDLSPAFDDFRSQVLHGLRQTRKTLPCKFFYDKRGSELFDQICELDAYYLTRTEIEILRTYGAEISAELGPRCRIVEYGSGSSLKTRLLLEQAEDPVSYVPLDISREHLLAAAEGLAASFPGLRILPVCAHYTWSFLFPTGSGPRERSFISPGPPSAISSPMRRDFLRLAAAQAGH